MLYLSIAILFAVIYNEKNTGNIDALRKRGDPMKKNLRKIILAVTATVLLIALCAGILWLYIRHTDYGFARTVSDAEAARRAQVVTTAEQWLGSNESDGSHQKIIDLYNSHTPLAQGYEVQYSDNWCATFVSAVAIELGITDIIPTECGCQRQIGLFQDLGCWVEDDDYVPLPGDIIYYCMDNRSSGDCTGWSDHVGIVVGTSGRRLKVIEGNYSNQVTYRYLPIGHSTIRGYAVPNYHN